MNEQEKQFKDGCNSGYLLAKHEPDLCEAILAAAGVTKSNSEFSMGLSVGHDVYHVEMMIDQNRKEIGWPPEKKVISETSQKLATDYKSGFNNGYVLSKYEPELTQKLLKTAPENPNEYYKGLVSGKQEHDMEKIRERLKGMNRNNTPSKKITKDKGRNK